MIRHVSVGTDDVELPKLFCDAVLPIVGIHLTAAEEGGPGYGSGTFHFSVQVPIDGRPATVGDGTRIAFAGKFARWSTAPARPRWITVAAATANRDCAPVMMQTTMARSSVIRTGTKSRL